MFGLCFHVIVHHERIEWPHVGDSWWTGRIGISLGHVIFSDSSLFSFHAGHFLDNIPIPFHGFQVSTVMLPSV